MIADPLPLVSSPLARRVVPVIALIAGIAGGLLVYLAMAPYSLAGPVADLFARDGSMDSFTAERQQSLWPWLLSSGVVLAAAALLLQRFRDPAAVWLTNTAAEAFVSGGRSTYTSPLKDRGRAHDRYNWLLLGSVLLLSMWALYMAIGLVVWRTGSLSHLDVFFASDPPRVIRDLTRPDQGQRSHIHPLFTLWFNPLTSQLVRWTGSPELAALLVNTLAGAACAPLALLVFRRAGMPVRLSLPFALMMAFSAAHLIFSAVPDTFIFGGLSMVLLCVAVSGTGRQLLAKAGAGLFALGITVSNLAPALLLLTSASPGRLRARLMSGVTLAVVILTAGALLASVQKRLFPGTRHFLNPDSYGSEISRFIVGSGHSGSWPVKSADLMLHMWIYTFVGPVPFMRQQQEFYEAGIQFHRRFECHVCERFIFGKRKTRQLPVRSHPAEITFETPHPPRLTAPGIAGALLWMVLVVAACKEMILRRAVWNGLLTGIVLAIAFHFTLHMVFGDDLFLYTPHWAFLVVAAVALALRHYWNSRWLLPVLSLALAAEIAANAVLVRSILDILNRPVS